MQFVKKIAKNGERRLLDCGESETAPARNYSLYTVSLPINVRWSMQTNIKQIASNYKRGPTYWKQITATCNCRRGPSSPTRFYVRQVYGNVRISIRTGLFMPESKSVS